MVTRNREEVQQRRNLVLRNLIVGSMALGEMKRSHCLTEKAKMTKQAPATGARIQEMSHLLNCGRKVVLYRLWQCL